MIIVNNLLVTPSNESEAAFMNKNRDRRLSICMAADLAAKLDERLAQIPNTNRSQVVEQAVRIWLWDSLVPYANKEEVLATAMKLYEEQQERELYRAYYADLSETARAEIAGWTRVGEESAPDHWPPYDA
jgi:hypothetical protein